MEIRRPYDKLGGCVWLARIVDKTRHFLNGTLDSDYQRSFCNPGGVDGFFLRHFEIEGDRFIATVKNKTDQQIVDWFLSDSSRAEIVDEWNHLAPRFGMPGCEGEDRLRWALENVYTDCQDPRVDSTFKLLALDEGYLDEYLESLQPDEL